MDVGNLKNKAEECRKAGKYREVIDIYSEIVSEEAASFNEADLWRFAFSLRKLGEVKEAIELYRNYYKYNIGSAYNNNLYASCLYDYYINKDNEEIKYNEDDFFEAAEIITKIAKQGRNSIYEATVIKVVEYYKTKEPCPESLISEWLDKLKA